MRTTLLFLLSCFLSATLFAQSPTRLVGIKSYIHNGSGSFDKVDSTSLIYKPGNMATGGADEYYDDELKMDEEYKFLSPTGGAFNPQSKTEYEYNANGDIVKRTLSTAATMGGALTPSGQMLYSYDGSGNILEHLQLSWNQGAAKWDTASRMVYVYDANNNLLVNEIEVYSGSGWQGFSRTTNTYDANNLLNMLVLETANQGVYDTTLRYFFHYNTAGLVDTGILQTYDAQTGLWRNSQRNIFAYNGNGIETASENHTWNAISNVWEEASRTERYFDAQGVLMYTDEFSWGQSWQITGRDTIVKLPGSPNKVQHIRKVPSLVMPGLFNSLMREMTYNGDGHMTLHTSHTWDAAQNQWYVKSGQDSTVYYYSFPTSVNDVVSNTLEISVYPNPASSYINVSIANSDKPSVLAVYDMAGRLMVQQQIPAGKGKVQLPVQQLSAGQYILSVKNEQGKSSTSFVVR